MDRNLPETMKKIVEKIVVVTITIDKKGLWTELSSTCVGER